MRVRDGAAGEDGGMADRLKNATSPYLLQHADNPVDWWPWSPEAFAAARERDVPVMLSVGYSACHWCHVMAHESFEDPQTAALLNDNLVSIKVDREERPDVDAVYMTATQAMTGQGGWPMTVFMTPDGKPFYCGTYFPRDRFQRLVLAVTQAWREDRSGVDDQASRIAAALAEQAGGPWPGGDGTGDLAAVCDQAVLTLARDYDAQRGGFGGAPKFPPSMVCEFLLRHSERPGAPGGGPGAGDGHRDHGGDGQGRHVRPAWRRVLPATAWTPPGWCRTSRRCSTTTPCSPGPTRTCGGAPPTRWPAGWLGTRAPG